MASKSTTKAALAEDRERLGLTQQAMADRLGLSLRALQGIEQGEAKYRLVHRLAVERVALAIASERSDADMLPASVRKDVRAVADQNR